MKTLTTNLRNILLTVMYYTVKGLLYALGVFVLSFIFVCACGYGLS